MSFNAGAIKATATLDLNPFEQGLAQARRAGDQATRDPIRFRLDLDRRDFDAQWRAFEAEHRDEFVSVDVRAATAKASAGLDTWRKAQTAQALALAVGVDTANAAAHLDTFRETQSAHSINLDVDTSRADQAVSQFGSHAGLILAGVVALAPFVGAAIEGGIGTAFVATAVLAQKSNADVRQSYTDLWHNVVAETKNATNQLVPQLVSSGHELDQAFAGLGPEFDQAFAAAGPDIVALTNGVTGLAHNAMPGLTAAMQNSLPVAAGFSSLLGQVGTTVSTTASQVGQNSQAMGVDLQSLGSVTQSVVGLATNIITGLGVAWAQNAGTTDQAISGIASALSGLAAGALPVVSTAFGVAAAAVDDVTHVLGPLTPLIGGLTAAWLVLMGAVKLTSVASGLIQKLASGIVSFGVAAESGAARGAGLVASMEGVGLASSETAIGVKAAGAATADFALTAGATVETLAGPLALALVAGAALFGLFSLSQRGAAQSTQELSAATDSLTSAFEQSRGAVDQNVVKSLQGTQAYKDAAAAAGQLGISQSTLTTAVTQGGAALDQLRAQLQAVIAEHTDAAAKMSLTEAAVKGTDRQITDGLDSQGQAAKDALAKLNALVSAYGKGKISAGQLQAAQQQVAATLVQGSATQETAASVAQQFGLSISDVTTAFQGMVLAGGNAVHTPEQMAESFIKGQLAVDKAKQSITDFFTQADQAVAQAKDQVTNAGLAESQAIQQVTDARHAAAQAAQQVVQAQQGVVTAEHSVQQAHQQVRDALAGVASAEQQYTQAVASEHQAQVALNQARQQAIRDLISLHLQLADQVASTESARVSLFDAEQSAATLGVTTANAHAIAAQQVTKGNEARVKAAIQLVQAMNAVNDAANTQKNLTQQVADADKAGINGAQGVVQAEQALRSAHQQVTAAAQGVAKAQRQVADAEFGVKQAEQQLVQAHQAVSTAAYNEQKAHDAIRTAQDNEKRSAQQLAAAKASLRAAQDADSHSLDLGTTAGRNNLDMMLQLWDAIQATGMPKAEQYRTLVKDVADAFHLSTQKAADFLKQEGLIPKDFRFKVTAVGDVDLSNLPKGVQLRGTTGFITSKLAAGGQVFGPGGPRDDLIPAMLSNREYVQPVDSVDYYGVGTMEAIRQKRLPKDFMARFADGGLAARNVAWGILGVSYQDMANTAKVMGIKGIPSLPQFVPQQFNVSDAGLRGSRAANEAIVRHVWSSMFGWGPREWPATVALLMQESGFNNLAQNPTSTAFGMFQFLNSTWGGYGIPKTADPTLQAIAGGRYIQSRYGDPIGAEAHERAFNWYSHGGLVIPTVGPAVPLVSRDQGGPLEQGYTLVYNGTGDTETVITADQKNLLMAALQSRKPIEVTVNQDNRGHQFSAEELAAANARHMKAALSGVSL